MVITLGTSLLRMKPDYVTSRDLGGDVSLSLSGLATKLHAANFLRFQHVRIRNRSSGYAGVFIPRLNTSRVIMRHDLPTIDHEGSKSDLHPLAVETLRTFPAEDLFRKVVLVRCDFSVSFKEGKIIDEEPILAAVPTISYLRGAGARIVLASHWHPFQFFSGTSDTQIIADCLSLHLNQRIFVAKTVIGDAVQNQIEDLTNGDVFLLGNLQLHKEEAANDKQFSRSLTEKVDIFVNDAFPIAHRILASTVGVARFSSVRLAGFELERELLFLMTAMDMPKLPFVAIVGGSKVSKILGVLYNLINKCSTIIITGSMIYTFFSALGYHHHPSPVVEKSCTADVLNFLSAAATRRVHVLLPEDLKCVREGHIDASFRLEALPEGWLPVCLGVNSWKNIRSTLQNAKMALWIGPVSVSDGITASQASRRLARIFGEISKTGCITIAGGKEAATFLKAENVAGSISHISRAGAALWELLKGVNLSAVSALDVACPEAPVWDNIYRNPGLPLFVDIGSGNGIFNIEMARRFEKSLNFLGFEIRKKLVDHCLNCVAEQQLPNVYFIRADAATAFERVVLSYPGQVVVVAIQCPDPNFSNTDTRRRMVQKLLIEGTIHILPKDGKIYLQSDVKEVAKQLRQDFLEYGKSHIKLSIQHQDKSKCDAEGWLLDNPYGVLTDWESHVLLRGDRMYRVLLSRL